MNAPAYTRIPVIILAALVLAACPGKKNKHHDDDGGAATPPPPPSYYVDVTFGVDTNAGTSAAPFKTITHALTVATTSGSTVHVAPGDYDFQNNNETFPVTVPAGVLLIGDETSKGGGGAPTRIVGKGPAPAGFDALTVTVVPGTGSTIAGLTIKSDVNTQGHTAVLLSNSTVTLRNNTVTEATRAGVEFDVSTNHVITGNQIVNNGGSGLAFFKGGVGSKVGNNVIAGNSFGVEYDVAGGDLGSGSAGTGGNVFSCNQYADLFAGSQTTPITIPVAGNSWDHTTPTFFNNGSPTTACTLAGDDICDYYGTATINASSPTQAANPVCP